MKIFPLFIGLCFVACTQSHVPCQEDFDRIRNKPAIPRVYDCKHKTFDYCNILLANGYAAYIVIGRVKGLDTLHARVVYFENEIEKMADPTLDVVSGLPVKNYSDWTLIKKCEKPEDVFDVVLMKNGKLFIF